MYRNLSPTRRLVILSVIAFNLVILTYRLPSNPPGFFIDESIYGFEAYTILKTRGFSSSGEFLPRLFLESGSTARNHGLYAYWAIPFIGLFGMNAVSVRLTSVVSSIALLCVIYFMLRSQVSEWSILLAAVWWPITSWVFLLSRFGVELISTALVSTLTMWLLIKIYRSKETSNCHILLLDVFVVLQFFMYASGPALASGYTAVGLLILLRKQAPAQYILKLILAPVAILLLSLPYLSEFKTS
jgi:4-amino-4-deoxy-L-arabinose transferase-like glycosyltransferase